MDTVGLLLAVAVTAGSVDDAGAARQIAEQLTSDLQPRLKLLWADSKFHNYELYMWLDDHESISWELEIVSRPDDAKGFKILPRRWVIERTFGWIMRWRRNSRDYE